MIVVYPTFVGSASEMENASVDEQRTYCGAALLFIADTDREMPTRRSNANLDRSIQHFQSHIHANDSVPDCLIRLHV